ncbi:uncharacterized protein OCT59_000715 [Rhizophagus irregularis]|uniref:uncharacterized protein n=1 Tax=Rhizophagus irregularis TaxID=588596 RepID=UPI003324D749|nr:hypothetical protein OCT59_000715 [Rhizophagus irregularis]
MYNWENSWPDRNQKNDFKQGLAQATIQMESSLGHKRKAKEIDNEYSLDKVWEIVIDVEKWYFMKYT